MYACMHAAAADVCGDELSRLALEFAPEVERTSPHTVVFSINGLRTLLGSPHRIASEICRVGYERHIKANLAIASNPDTALLIARNVPGVTLVTAGEESFQLASLPLTCLSMHDERVHGEAIETFTRWGLKTCEDLASLPEQGVAERLGESGVYLRNLACGKIHRPLRLTAPPTNYEERVALEHSIQLLEPLLFLLGRVLSELCGRLRSQSRAARLLEARFELETQKEHHCELEFPIALSESPAMLKLLQLHLERHPPSAPIVAFTLRVEPAEPRRFQPGFFLPPTPPPDKLQITLARIEGLVGKENVGSPVLLNTHRPDGFQMTTLNAAAIENAQNTISTEISGKEEQVLRLAIRLFRPALHARVRLAGMTPQDVLAPGVRGKVIQFAGPWKTSGEWWASTSWIREEWDVALDDGALYRIYREPETRQWYVHGMYD